MCCFGFATVLPFGFCSVLVSTDLCQIHMEDVFGPSLGRVSRSRSKVKVPGTKIAFFGPFGGCMRFMFGKTFLASRFCLCMKYLGGTAEWICTKFTRKTCFVPRSDEFEGQSQSSRSPGTTLSLP